MCQGTCVQVESRWKCFGATPGPSTILSPLMLSFISPRESSKRIQAQDNDVPPPVGKCLGGWIPPAALPPTPMPKLRPTALIGCGPLVESGTLIGCGPLVESGTLIGCGPLLRYLDRLFASR